MDFINTLTKEVPPWIIETSKTIDAFMLDINDVDLKDSIFIFDGLEMQDFDGFHREISMTMRFPDYYGKNIDALQDCLSDLSWINNKKYIIFFIKNFEFFLKKEGKENIDSVILVLSEIAKEWSLPVTLGEDWDRESIPFHIVLSKEEMA